MKRKTKILIVSIVGVGILAVGILAYYVYITTQTSPQNATENSESDTFAYYTQQMSKEKPQDVNVRSFIDLYGQTFEETRYEVMNSNPATWDKVMLDKVYFLITYHHQLGEYQSIERLLNQLDEAKAAGVDINNNTSHFDENYRQNLRQEITDIRNSRAPATNPTEVNNE